MSNFGVLEGNIYQSINQIGSNKMSSVTVSENSIVFADLESHDPEIFP